MNRRFYTLDVFTAQAFAGNPLAVVLDAQDLDEARMQSIAREFNLSETVFVTPPTDPAHRARVRIFTPGQEVPFAGHPTVGTAVLLAALDRQGQSGSAMLTLQEKIGRIPCDVTVSGPHSGHARFTLPRLPLRIGDLPDTRLLARGLGLQAADIGFSRHQPAIYSAGNPFCCVPLRSREAVSRARPQGEAFALAFNPAAHAPAAGGFVNAFVYCAEPLDPANRFHARMFAPAVGVPEDPATGSAAAAFAGAFMEFEQPRDGTCRFSIEQGDAMGRPSRIEVTLQVAQSQLQSARIGGEAVVISQGQLFA